MAMKQKCGAKTRSGLPCKNAAGYKTSHPGTGRCAFHGGATSTHELAAKRAAAAEAVRTYGLPRDIDPHVALLEEVHRTAGHVAYLAAIVADLEQAQLKQLDMSHRFEKVSVWVELYQKERAHLLDAARVAISCGVAERLVQVEEERAQIAFEAFRAALQDPDAALTDDQRRALMHAYGTRLRAVA